jgi:hypothetical protein
MKTKGVAEEIGLNRATYLASDEGLVELEQKEGRMRRRRLLENNVNQTRLNELRMRRGYDLPV